MPPVNCPTCGTSYKIPPDYKRQHATCKNCGSRFSTLKKSPSTKSSHPGLGRVTAKGITPKQLKQLFEKFEEVPRPPVTLMHRFVALLVVCTMLILPLLYLAFMAAVAYGTWWHATNNYVWMNVPHIRLTVIMFMLYLAILIGGIVWFFSLLKPLFVQIPPNPNSEGLSRKDEPALYAFCDQLADYVGAPRPDHIQLDLNVNASASYQTGMFGLTRKSFTLTLGIPLIAGTTVPQLAGVMAHEFGHFSQKGSTFLDRIIRRINLWFLLAIYGTGEETQDYFLDDEEDAGLIEIFAFISWLMSGMGKIVLWCLMHVGIFVSASLMRRMEFDADRYEIATVGSRTFVETSKRFIALNVAFAVATQHVFSSLRGSHLPDDLAAFTAALANQSSKITKKANKIIKKEKHSFFSSHPTTRDRIRAAEKRNEPGYLHTSLPATALFNNFHKNSKGLTSMLYSWRYGHTYDPESSRTTKEAIQSYLSTMER